MALRSNIYLGKQYPRELPKIPRLISWHLSTFFWFFSHLLFSLLLPPKFLPPFFCSTCTFLILHLLIRLPWSWWMGWMHWISKSMNMTFSLWSCLYLWNCKIQGTKKFLYDRDHVYDLTMARMDGLTRMDRLTGWSGSLWVDDQDGRAYGMNELGDLTGLA